MQKKGVATAYPKAESLHRVLTVRGRTGAVLLMMPIKQEGNKDISQAIIDGFPKDPLKQTRFIVTDDPNESAWKGFSVGIVLRYLLEYG